MSTITSPAAEAGFLIAETARLARTAFDIEMAGSGVSGASLRTLARLLRADGQTQAELSRAMEVSRVAMGEMIDRLERDGWVERRPDGQDRRVWRIFVTPETRRRLPTFRALASGLEARCFADFSTQEVQQLHDLLVRLRNTLLKIRAQQQQDQSEDVV
jgi:DNA-binding MarR family transcriptional regulator